jgi:hypothetical protein
MIGVGPIKEQPWSKGWRSGELRQATRENKPGKTFSLSAYRVQTPMT